MARDVYERRVKDVMSRHVVTIDVTDSVHDALQLMAENKVAALPVVGRNDRCVGMLSTSDLVEVSRDLEARLSELESSEELFWGAYIDKLGSEVGHQSITELMSENVVTVHEDTPLFEAASRMLREHIHRLPVVGENNRVRGILSTTDILGAFVEGAPLKAG